MTLARKVEVGSLDGPAQGAIMMTSLTLVASMQPLAFHWAPGGEAMVPLARALIGGMLASTFLTLYLLPCVHTLVTRDGPVPTATA